MKKLSLLGALALSVACGKMPPPVVRPDPGPAPVLYRAISTLVRDEGGRKIVDAACVLDVAGEQQALSNAADGYVLWNLVPAAVDKGHLTCAAEGFEPYEADRTFATHDNEPIAPVVMRALHFDPSRLTEADLLENWRGAISTVRMAIPYGPRPNDPTNVFFTDMYGVYDDHERARARHEYIDVRGYKQWPIGPINSGNYGGYYPWLDYTSNPDRLLDHAQEIYDAGGIPEFFLVPAEDDRGFNVGGRLDWDKVERELTPIYMQPRWQKLVRLAVFCWECDGVVQTNEDWLRAVRWMARVFPNAKRGIHFTAGHGAPCNHEDIERRGLTEAKCWANVAPYIHFFAAQDFSMGGWYIAAGNSYEQQWRANIADNCRRFATGYGDFPTNSATPGRPIRWLWQEYSSFKLFHDRTVPESEAQRWGDMVLENPFCGPIGAGDGTSKR